MKRAVYAGSFDPITNGHVWMIEQGVRLFDELIVAIGINPDKKYSFPLDERVRVIKESLIAFPRLRVESFENQFLVNFAKSVDAQFILRGVRDVKDFEFEKGMRHINTDLQPDIATVFLMPPREIAEVSSSLVKGLIGPKGWRDIVKRYVPDAVFALILQKHGSR